MGTEVMASLPRRAAAFSCLALVLPAAARPAAPTHSWAQAQIKLVTGAGLFAATPATFDPDAPLTGAALGRALGVLSGPTVPASTKDAHLVTVEDLDRTLVGALGLGDSAYRFYLAARNAGLDPPARFGTETVARLLGLRLDHPAAQDDLELQPQQIATRAEAAYSFAQILALAGGDHGAMQTRHATAAAAPLDFSTAWQVQQVKAWAATFALPPLTAWQQRILTTAFSYVGYPYVWGGTGGGSAGFDCSGFVWAVYKLTAYPDARGLADVLHGRTTMQMSGEVPKAKRIGVAALQPGDVMFFGRGPHSKPAQIGHAAIYVGNGWLVQSSGEGVALAPFDGWYRTSFAWARRPLAEADLG
jgi:cell wall-associated NlpC family hydrolase